MDGGGEKNVPGTENSKSKDPGVGARLACSRTMKEVMRGKNTGGQVVGFYRPLTVGPLACHLSELGDPGGSE